MTARTAVGTPIFDALVDELRMTWPSTAAASSHDGVMAGVLPEAEAIESAEEQDAVLAAT